MPSPHIPRIEVKEESPRIERLEDLPGIYEGRLARPETIERLRRDAERLGEARVFWALDMRHVRIGPLGRDDFLLLVGSEPEHDDLERVNCREAGTVGHLMCGWCPEHGGPRFRCGCLAGEDDARRFAFAAGVAEERLRRQRPRVRHAHQLWFYGGPDNDACTHHHLYRADGTETFVSDGEFEFVDEGY